MTYWLQLKAPAGNWYDSMGSNNLRHLLDMAKQYRDDGVEVRLVARTDEEIAF